MNQKTLPAGSVFLLLVSLASIQPQHGGPYDPQDQPGDRDSISQETKEERARQDVYSGEHQPGQYESGQDQKKAQQDDLLTA
jgi:hypothetical protein